MKPKLKKQGGALRIRKAKFRAKDIWFTGVLRILLLVIWIVWLIVAGIYRLFIKLPSKPSCILGIVRTVCWILFLCYFKFDSISESDDNLLLQLLMAVLPFVGIGFLLVSFAIMLSFRYPWVYNGIDRSIPGLENHPNLQSTMDILDAQLSSSKTRSNFIESFLKGK